ncbi:MAG: threonine synthase, partial [Pseudomonadales bacterium]
MRYISNRGGAPSVDFETAILDGFAADGGLYVPEQLPRISETQLQQWQGLSYPALAFEILSLFIERTCVSASELKHIIDTAYAPFEHEQIIPLKRLESRDKTYIMELFHGPTQSFKDVGLAFLVNLVNFFLARKNERLTLVVATTGDTGPATAYFSAGKSNLDTWVLYPQELITEEQARQMTCLPHNNIHPFAVSSCPQGGDDLDEVIAKLYADSDFKQRLQLSSVNSINWGRVMMQTVHYFFGYLQLRAQDPTARVSFSTPSGGFGNLCAGAIAREMGLPAEHLVAANNRNACLHRLFTQGVFSRRALCNTPSSAIDILIPFNFWRYLSIKLNDPTRIAQWMDDFTACGEVRFDTQTFEHFKQGFLSHSASDAQTLSLIEELYREENYLLDPHTAVSVQARDSLAPQLEGQYVICLATAHPAKFPAA